MALFFDEDWFSKLLSQKNKSRADLARALNMDEETIAMIWKDQRAFTPHEVSQTAQFLDMPAEDIAKHAGIATPQPHDARIHDARIDDAQSGDIGARLDEICARLERIERALAELRHMALARDISRTS